MNHMNLDYTVPFNLCGYNIAAHVGGKNAALGELINASALLHERIPDGFAITTEAYKRFIKENHLEPTLSDWLKQIKRNNYSNLNEVSSQIKRLFLQAKFPEDAARKICAAYNELARDKQNIPFVAVRSSAVTEDSPDASFAGMHDSFLYIKGEKQLLEAIRKCYASVYNARAIKYREEQGFVHEKTLLSVGIQRMVHAEESCSGTAFSIDPDSGFRDVVVIHASWGLGESIVQGKVIPDEYHVFKPKIDRAASPILSKRMGTKAHRIVLDKKTQKLVTQKTPAEMCSSYCLSAEEIIELGRMVSAIEGKMGFPVDVEWAKDGKNGALNIVQARPETVHSRRNPFKISQYRLLEHAEVLATGFAVGQGIIAGQARILTHPDEAGRLKRGEILITESTSPDWDPILKKAAAIISAKGGRTSHAAIVARELGTLAAVGTQGALTNIRNGEWITLDCSKGKLANVYRGRLKWSQTELDFTQTELPDIQPMLILADPEQAYPLSFYPNKGVGLLRLEFAITHSVKIHPMAIAHFELVNNPSDRILIERLTQEYPSKKEYFIDKLSQAVGTIAAAFYPKEVLVRLSDFKSNEYQHLIGGNAFEKAEENPMLGFRGALRYGSQRYADGFNLECAALKYVRENMGLDNVKIMIPFCRTPKEAEVVLAQLEKNGLRRGHNGLEIYVMAEVPSNILEAEAFAELFDGFSIGSNDLTQLTLGIDRDSDQTASLFNENSPSVKKLITQLIHTAHRYGLKVGLCGQAPSDNADFARFLAHEGIDSIAFTPDALVRGISILNAIKREEHLISTL
jgi:pyruvate,water dikinase